jgi:ankyrin repeat protein
MSDIMQAICEDNYLQVKKLIKNGIDINEIIENEDNENDECLMFYAIHKKCSFETLKLMIENGVDIEFTDSHGVGLLDEAIVSGNMEFITYLLDEQNLNPNQTKRKSGLTPLIQASCYGNIDLVKLLISHGADVNIKDKLNLSATDYARKLQRKKMQQFLEELS